MNSFDLAVKAVMGVSEVAKFESVLKIWDAHYVRVLSPIFAQNFCITPEKRVVRAGEPLHRVSRRVFHMEAALLQQYWEPSNLPKCLYYSKGISLSQFIEFVPFCRKTGYGGF